MDQHLRVNYGSSIFYNKDELASNASLRCTNVIKPRPVAHKLWRMQLKSRGLSSRGRTHRFNIPLLFASLPSVQPITATRNLVLTYELALGLDQAIEELLLYLGVLIVEARPRDRPFQELAAIDAERATLVLHCYMCNPLLWHVWTQHPVGAGMKGDARRAKIEYNWERALERPPSRPPSLLLDAQQGDGSDAGAPWSKTGFNSFRMIFEQIEDEFEDEDELMLDEPLDPKDMVSFDDFDFDQVTRFGLTQAMLGLTTDDEDYSQLRVWSKEYTEMWKRIAQQCRAAEKAAHAEHMLEKSEWDVRMEQAVAQIEKSLALVKKLEEIVVLGKKMTAETDKILEEGKELAGRLETTKEELKQLVAPNAEPNKPKPQVAPPPEKIEPAWKSFTLSTLCSFLEGLGLKSLAKHALPTIGEPCEVTDSKILALEILFGAAFDGLSKEDLLQLDPKSNVRTAASPKLIELKKVVERVSVQCKKNPDAMAVQRNLVSRFQAAIAEHRRTVEMLTGGRVRSKNQAGDEMSENMNRETMQLEVKLPPTKSGQTDEQRLKAVFQEAFGVAPYKIVRMS